jgi:predicted TIM-barrel fold metal-dependent hydrolase
VHERRRGVDAGIEPQQARAAATLAGLVERSRQDLLLDAGRISRRHVDTSAYVLRRLPPAFVDWMKGIGKTRVMFGTNWPMLSPVKSLEGLNGLGLSAQQTEMFLSGNARRVFKL